MQLKSFGLFYKRWSENADTENNNFASLVPNWTKYTRLSGVNALLEATEYMAYLNIASCCV